MSTLDPDVGLPEPGGASKLCSIFVVDVVGFGGRPNDVQRFMRDALYRMLREAFKCSKVHWDACRHEDRGDGIFIVIPAKFPTIYIVEPLLDRLHARLRFHNKMSRDSACIQLRAALHAGHVQSDNAGISGENVVHAFRLVEALPLRRALIRHRAELAFVASNYVYQEVLRFEDDRGVYERVDVQLKETHSPAWLRVFGVPGEAIASVPSA
jgi:hypothetical protein